MAADNVYDDPAESADWTPPQSYYRVGEQEMSSINVMTLKKRHVSPFFEGTFEKVFLGGKGAQSHVLSNIVEVLQCDKVRYRGSSK